MAERGLKLRVAARDKNWVQVSDPATSANGWIYSRFLKPTEPPASPRPEAYKAAHKS